MSWTAEYDGTNHMITVLCDGTEVAKVYGLATLDKITDHQDVALSEAAANYLTEQDVRGYVKQRIFDSGTTFRRKEGMDDILRTIDWDYGIDVWTVLNRFVDQCRTQGDKDYGHHLIVTGEGDWPRMILIMNQYTVGGRLYWDDNGDNLAVIRFKRFCSSKELM